MRWLLRAALAAAGLGTGLAAGWAAPEGTPPVQCEGDSHTAESNPRTRATGTAADPSPNEEIPGLSYDDHEQLSSQEEQLQESWDRAYYKGLPRSWGDTTDPPALDPAIVHQTALNLAKDANAFAVVDCDEPPCIVAFSPRDVGVENIEFDRRLFEAYYSSPYGCAGTPVGYGTSTARFLVLGICIGEVDEAFWVRLRSRVEAWDETSPSSKR